MMLTSILGIIVGSKIGKRIPENFMKAISSVVFVLFGLIKLDSMMTNRSNFYIMMIISVLIELVLLVRFRRIASGKTESKFKDVSQELQQQHKLISIATESICKGEESCGKCDSAGCLIGYAKVLINNTDTMTSDKQNILLGNLLNKEYDKDKVIDGLALIITNYIKYKLWDRLDNPYKKVQNIFEYIIFDKTYTFKGDLEKYIQDISKSNEKYAIILQNRVNNNI